MSNSKKKSPEERLKTLEKRVQDLEVQMAGCLRFMRYHAEKEAKEKDPNFKVHKINEA